MDFGIVIISSLFISLLFLFLFPFVAVVVLSGILAFTKHVYCFRGVLPGEMDII